MITYILIFTMYQSAFTTYPQQFTSELYGELWKQHSMNELSYVCIPEER